MVELTPKERLQPSLIERLTDDVRSVKRRLEIEKGLLFAELHDDEIAAYERLLDPELRRGPTLTSKELEPFERLGKAQMERLQEVVRLEQQNRFESVHNRVFNLGQFRQSVVRNLSDLFNTENLETSISLADYPLARNSVLNFGAPAFVGMTISSLDESKQRTLVRAVKEAVARFEPRLIEDSIQIRLAVNSEEMSARAVRFEIEADVDAKPAFHLLLRSVVDLEDGSAELEEIAD